MKRQCFSNVSILILVLAAAAVATAQVRVPRASPRASVSQTIGVTDISITYHRPAVKGRTIWGDPPAGSTGESTMDDGRNRPPNMPIVPYGRLWRTGANDATLFVVSDAVQINGQPLPAGEYSLHTIPGRDEWTIVFNGTANQWGSFNYDASKDLLRVKAKPQNVSENQEYMSFNINPTSDSAAQVVIAWEKVRVPFTVAIKDVVATTLARAREAVSAAKSDDWQTPYQAATYAKTNKANDDAEKWFEQSLRAIDEQLKVKESFQNLTRKLNTLIALGRNHEAIAVGETAIAVGKKEKADTKALEKRIADLKSAAL